VVQRHEFICGASSKQWHHASLREGRSRELTDWPGLRLRQCLFVTLYSPSLCLSLQCNFCCRSSSFSQSALLHLHDAFNMLLISPALVDPSIYLTTTCCMHRQRYTWGPPAACQCRPVPSIGSPSRAHHVTCMYTCYLIQPKETAGSNLGFWQ